MKLRVLFFSVLRDITGSGEIVIDLPDASATVADLLDHLIAVARQEGMTRLSLETGSTNAFQPALALYLSRGFREGEAFGGYAPNPFSRFFHLTPV